MSSINSQFQELVSRYEGIQATYGGLQSMAESFNDKVHGYKINTHTDKITKKPSISDYGVVKVRTIKCADYAISYIAAHFMNSLNSYATRLGSDSRDLYRKLEARKMDLFASGKKSVDLTDGKVWRHLLADEVTTCMQGEKGVDVLLKRWTGLELFEDGEFNRDHCAIEPVSELSDDDEESSEELTSEEEEKRGNKLIGELETEMVAARKQVQVAAANVAEAAKQVELELAGTLEADRSAIELQALKVNEAVMQLMRATGELHEAGASYAQAISRTDRSLVFIPDDSDLSGYDKPDMFAMRKLLKDPYREEEAK